MIEIVLSVCLVSTPQTCKDVSLPVFAEKVTPYGCMFRGQVAAAEWINGHPRWQIKKWKCAPAQELAKA